MKGLQINLPQKNSSTLASKKRKLKSTLGGRGKHDEYNKQNGCSQRQLNYQNVQNFQKVIFEPVRQINQKQEKNQLIFELIIKYSVIF